MANSSAEVIKKEDIKVSAFVLEFHPEETDTISIVNEITTRADKIDFSYLIFVRQKDNYDKDLKVEIVKIEDDPAEERTMELASIPLSRDNRRKEYEEGLVGQREAKKAKWDPYKIEDRIKINFRGVPIVGVGRYAVVIGIENNSNFFVLDCQYFDVKNRDEDS